MRTPAICALLALLGTAGCAVEDNLRMTIGETVPMAGLPPVMPDTREGLIGSADPNDIPGDAPSLAGLDRSNLEPVEFRVPIDGVAHHPHNTMPLRTRTDHARQRGEFPTMETVLEQSDPSLFVFWHELVVVPAWNVVETLWLVPTLIIDGPWETTTSPQQITGRTNPRTPMLTPGIITLTRAEIEDLQSAELMDATGADPDQPVDQPVDQPTQTPAEEPQGE